MPLEQITGEMVTGYEPSKSNGKSKLSAKTKKIMMLMAMKKQMMQGQDKKNNPQSQLPQ